MKKIAFVLSLMLLTPLFFVGCNSSGVSLSTYNIEVSYNDELQILDCKQELSYVNNSDNAFSNIPFFLYANSFAEGVKTISSFYQAKAYPKDESYGFIEFSSILVKGQEALFEIGGQDNSILTIYLPEELYPNEKIQISMKYTITLANINHRLGYGENTVNLGNFYPIACVYEEGKGFIKNQFSSNGDPFYSEVANYKIEITYPQKYIIASTGTGKTKVVGESKKTSIIASKTRDFCMVLSQKFQVKSKRSGKVDVRYYYYDDDNADTSLRVGCDAISTFSSMFGEYPYSQFSIVQSNFVFGGMEYPNLVLISDDLPSIDDRNYVIVHETAHQWWYGIVGNNQYKNAWQDESLTEYSTALFFEKNTEYAFNYKEIVASANAVYRNFLEIYGSVYDNVDRSMTRNLREYDTEPEYVNCVYVKGIIMYDSIREAIGDKRFFKCLKKYYRTFSYKNPQPEELIGLFENVSGVDVEEFFNMWLEGREILI